MRLRHIYRCALVLLLGAATSTRASAADPRDATATDVPAPVTRVHAATVGADLHPERPSHPLRTIAEITVVMLPFATIFWVTNDDNEAGAGHVPTRIFEPQRIAFDEKDELITNGLFHPINGGVYYQIARSNGAGPGGSLVAAFIASTIWEFAVEYSQRPSLNDLLATPLGGMAIGEPLYRLGGFFGRSACCRLGALLAPPSVFNDAIDRRKPERVPLRQDGLPADAWVRLESWVGGGTGVSGNGQAPAGLLGFGIDTELVDLPAAGRPGRVTLPLRPGDATAVSLRTAGGPRLLTSFNFSTRVGIAGLYMQDIRTGHGAAGDGYRAAFEAATAFEYARDGLSDEDVEEFAAVNLIGPAARVEATLGRLRFRGSAEGYIDGAAVHSPAFDVLVDSRSLVPTTSPTYYFALGLTGRIRASVALGGLEGGVALSFDAFHSVDDTRAQVTDAASADELERALLRAESWGTRARAWISNQLPGTPLTLPRAELEYVSRTSSVGSVRRTGEGVRLLVGAGVRF